MKAICVKCGAEKHPTTAVEEGWQLQLVAHGQYVSALCWRCEREQRASRMTDYRAKQAGEQE